MVEVTKILSSSERGIKSDRGIKVENSQDYIDASRKDLTMSQLRGILVFAGISMMELSSMLPISERQLSRYNDDKILGSAISARLIQIADLYQFGYKVFENEKKFQNWMNSKIRALCALEILANTTKDFLPPEYIIQSIRIPKSVDSNLSVLTIDQLPKS